MKKLRVPKAPRTTPNTTGGPKRVPGRHPQPPRTTPNTTGGPKAVPGTKRTG